MTSRRKTVHEAAPRAGEVTPRSVDSQRLDAGAVELADPRLVSMLARLSRAAAVFAVVTGFLVLAGWALDIVLLKSVGIGMATMKPNTAFAFVLAGVALWVLQSDQERCRTRIVAGACSAAVMTIGLLSLSQDLAGWNLGIDQLLFTEPASAIGTRNPGRMAPTTALSFLLVGGALQLLALPGRRWHHLVRTLASAVLLISTLAVFGYAYGAQSMYRVPFYSSMAIHTAVVFLMLSLAVLYPRAGSGWTSVIASRGVGGIMLRHAWLPSIVLLFLLGLLRLHGENTGLYTTEFGLALMVMLSIIVLTVFLWRNAILLDEEDARRKRAEKARTILAAIVENANDAIFARTLDGTITSWNAAAERMFGYTAAEAIGRPSNIILLPEQHRYVTDNNEKLKRGDAISAVEGKRITKDGRIIDVLAGISPVKNDTGEIIGAAAIIRDISERKQAEERIDYLAQYDAVTRLPNRRLFNDRLTLALARDKRIGAMTALLLLDLDRFKQVNESLGHGTGDKVLQAVTARLKERLREVDTIARLGGDEFVVILESVNEKAQALRVAEKIVEAMAEPFVLEGEEIFITASVGVAIYPADADSVETLIENAELAMYQAKHEGRNTLQLYACDQSPRRSSGLGMESRLRRAIERDELLLHYQPKVDIKSGAIVGAEALVRWRNPELGLVSPADFIPLAEETGLIVPIGEWVLHSACAQASAWRRDGHPIAVAVNLSARQFRQKNLCEMVKQTLADSGLDAGHLELEITESMVMHRPEQTIATLQQLHDIGLSLSVDDFGTGYSSLSYLKRFPVHKLKVDQSFVRELHKNADDAAIVRAVIALAQNLNLKTIAEGVETEQQLIYLAGLHCDEYQGYYFSKPLPADEFLRLLQTRHAARPGAARTARGEPRLHSVSRPRRGDAQQTARIVNGALCN